MLQDGLQRAAKASTPEISPAVQRLYETFEGWRLEQVEMPKSNRGAGRTSNWATKEGLFNELPAGGSMQFSGCARDPLRSPSLEDRDLPVD